MALLPLIVSAAALGGGYAWAKGFVKTRLRFVDAVHTAPAPWIAGIAVAIVATPFTWLPLVPHLAALTLGAGVGFGVRSAQRTRLLPPGDE